MVNAPPNPARYSFAYTVGLYVVSAVAAMTIASHQMLIVMMQESEADKIVISILRFLQAVELIISAFAMAVAILRTRNAQSARTTTAAVSILLAFWPPFGTAVFIWWVVWIRPRERTRDNSGGLA